VVADLYLLCFFFQAEDGIRDDLVTGVQTCALPISAARAAKPGSVEQKVGDFFKSAMDTAAVDAAGLKPVEADLARVAAIASTPRSEERRVGKEGRWRWWGSWEKQTGTDR